MKDDSLDVHRLLPFMFTDADASTQCSAVTPQISPFRSPYSTFSHLLNGVFLTLIVAVGLVGHATVIAVLKSHQLRSRLVPFLIAISCWEAALLVTSWVAHSRWALTFGLIPLVGNHVYWYLVANPIAHACRTAVIWTQLTASVDQYNAVCEPFMHHVRSRKRICLWISLVAVASVLVNLPRVFECQIEHIPCILGNVWSSLPQLTTTDMYRSRYYFIIYRVIFSSVSENVVVSCVQLCITVFIWRAIRRSRRNASNVLSIARHAAQRSTSGDRVRRRAERAMNRMFLIIQIKHVCFVALPAIIDVFECITNEFADHEKGYGSEWMPYIVSVSNCIVVINAAASFIVLLGFCRRFRWQLMRLAAKVTVFSKASKRTS